MEEKDLEATWTEDLFNKVKQEEDISWDRDMSVSTDIINLIQENRLNFIDLAIIGHCLIEQAYAIALRRIEMGLDMTNTILANILASSRLDNNNRTRITKDFLLLTYAHLGKPKLNFEVDISDSNRISVNLKRRFEILAKNNFRCIYCGRSPPEVKLQLDHIFPRSKGGRDIASNLAPACFECNSGKRDRIIEELKEEVCNEEGVQTNK